MKSVPFLSILLICAGCMTQEKIDRVLAELPPYMRQNIGEVKYEPLSPLSLILAGQVIEADPSATIYLYALADETVLKHEAFHSFELLAMHDRPLEWQKYYLCMGNTEAKLSTHLAQLLPVPTQWLPSDSSASVYGETNHFEEGAEVFVHHQPGRKWDCVCRFVYGIPQNQPHQKQTIAKRESTKPTVLSVIRKNFHDQALSYQRQKNTEREPPTNPTVLSILWRYIQDQVLSYHKQKIPSKEPPRDSTISSLIRYYYFD